MRSTEQTNFFVIPKWARSFRYLSQSSQISVAIVSDICRNRFRYLFWERL